MLKRLLIGLLTIALLAGGCAASKPIDTNEARAVLEAYLSAKVARDLPNMQELVVPELRDQQSAGTSNPHYFQFGIGIPSRVNEGVSFVAREFQRYTGNYFFTQVELSTYVVVRRDSRLLVDTAQRLGIHDTRATISVALNKSNPPQLVFMREGKPFSKPMTMDQLPDTFRPYGAPAGTEFGVGKAGFGAAAASPTLNDVAFVTTGTHPLLAVVQVGNTAVKGLDLWYGGSPGELAWSTDGKLLAAAAGRPSGGVELQVWDPSEGKKLEIRGLPGGPEVKVSNLRWVGDSLHFNIGTDTWTYNPATGAAQKA